MCKIKFDDLPEKMEELIKQQKEIMGMLVESAANRKEMYIPRKEVKKMLHVSSDVTIIDMERKKQLTPYRVGRRVLYKVGEVEETLKSFKRV